MAQGVIAITEQRDGRFRKVSYEVVSEGRRMADGLSTQLTAVVIGSGVDALVEEIKKYGPDRILVLDDPGLAAEMRGSQHQFEVPAGTEYSSKVAPDVGNSTGWVNPRGCIGGLTN